MALFKRLQGKIVSHSAATQKQKSGRARTIAAIDILLLLFLPYLQYRTLFRWVSFHICKKSRNPRPTKHAKGLAATVVAVVVRVVSPTISRRKTNSYQVEYFHCFTLPMSDILYRDRLFDQNLIRFVGASE